MSELRNTLACCFDPTSPRLTAFDIHEWIHSQLKLSEHSVLMIQIDGTRGQVFIKFTEFHFIQYILNCLQTRHGRNLNGMIKMTVTKEVVEMGFRSNC
jgi:hypothetical protein